MPLFLFLGFFFFSVSMWSFIFCFYCWRTGLSSPTPPTPPLTLSVSVIPLQLYHILGQMNIQYLYFSGDTNIVHIWVKQYIFSFLEKNHCRKQVAKILKKQLHPNPKLYKNIIYIKIKKYLSQNARMGRHDKTIVVYYKNVIKRKMTW